MPQFPIPDDWDGETFECFMIEWPFSVQWVGMLRGLITSPVRGRYWDGSTGNIKDAQAIGLEIQERNPVTTCEEIVAALEGIQVAIENIDTNSTTQVTIQNNIKNEITAVADAISFAQSRSQSNAVALSSAFAWSTSISQSFVGVKIINNVSLSMRSLEPGTTEPPTAGEEDDTGITSTAHSMTDDEICKRSFWLIYTSWKFFETLLAVEPYILGTILSAGGAIGDALETVTNFVTGGTIRQILPASVLVQVAHIFASLYEAGNLTSALEDIESFLSNVDDLSCGLATRVRTLDPTHIILGWVHDQAETVGGVDVAALGLLNIVFSMNSLAALYFQSPLIVPAPSVLAGFNDQCDSCEA